MRDTPVTDETMTEYYLLSTHGDGAFSTIVEGLDGVYDKLIESMYGSADDAPPDEAAAWKSDIEDEDQWTYSFDFGRWSWSQEFEDGSIYVTRVMDWSAVHGERD